MALARCSETIASLSPSFVSSHFWHFLLGINGSLTVLFPLCFSSCFPVWVVLWVGGKKEEKVDQNWDAKQRGGLPYAGFCLRSTAVLNLRIDLVFDLFCLDRKNRESGTICYQRRNLVKCHSILFNLVNFQKMIKLVLDNESDCCYTL